MNSNEYMRKYMLERYHKRMKEAHDILGGICKSCGASDSLDIDHIDPSTKSFTFAKMWSLKKETLVKELEKCQLLCKTCHNLKTLKQNGKVPARGTHGTLSSYRYCKCDLCKKAKREHHQKYRLNKKTLDSSAAEQPS